MDTMDKYHQTDHSILALIIITLITNTTTLIRTDPSTTPILRILESTRHEDWPNMANSKNKIINNSTKFTENLDIIHNGSEINNRNECFYNQFNKITIYFSHNRPSIYGPMAAVITEGLIPKPPYQYAGHRHSWQDIAINGDLQSLTASKGNQSEMHRPLLQRCGKAFAQVMKSHRFGLEPLMHGKYIQMPFVFDGLSGPLLINTWKEEGLGRDGLAVLHGEASIEGTKHFTNDQSGVNITMGTTDTYVNVFIDIGAFGEDLIGLAVTPHKCEVAQLNTIAFLGVVSILVLFGASEPKGNIKHETQGIPVRIAALGIIQNSIKRQPMINAGLFVFGQAQTSNDFSADNVINNDSHFIDGSWDGVIALSFAYLLTITDLACEQWDLGPGLAYIHTLGNEVDAAEFVAHKFTKFAHVCVNRGGSNTACIHGLDHISEVGDQFPYRVNEGSIADCVADKDKMEFRKKLGNTKTNRSLMDKTDSESI